jgi:tetratricopeptide (TPR) repeat protein
MNFLCRSRLPAILLVLLAGIIVYANTFQVPFVLDDETSIVNNAVIRSLENFYANSTGYEYLPNRYVAFWTFALNYHFGGLNVSGFHAVNLLIHLVGGLLVYTLLRLTFRTPYFREQVPGPGSKVQGLSPHSSLLAPHSFIPLFAALLFVVHPVQTQAVTYIVQRMTSLATMFYLLSVVLYVQARLRLESRVPSPESRDSKDQGPGDKDAEPQQLVPVLLLAASVVSAVLAMMTKPIAFTLPLAILLYEICFFRGAWKRRLFCLLPLLATLPIVPMTFIDIEGSGSDILSDPGDQLRAGSMSRLDYLFTQFRVIVTYLRLLVLPVNQNLDYDYPVYTTFFTPPVFLSFLLLTVLFALGVFLFWRTRWVGIDQVSQRSARNAQSSKRALDPTLRLIAFGIFWFFLALSIESSLVPIEDIIVEHRLYLPGFGAAVAFSTVFCMMGRKFDRPGSGKLLVLVAVLIVVVLGFATWQRNHVWGGAIRLWQDVVAKSPNKGRAHNNLGVSLEDAGRRPEAFKTLSRAIAVDPDYYKSYYNLADLYLISGQPDAALPLLQTAIRLRSDFTEAYVKLGAALMRGGHFREVTIFLEENIDRIGEQAEARFYLGSAYAFLGQREAALRELEVVSRLDAQLAGSLAGLLGMNSNHGISHGRK